MTGRTPLAHVLLLLMRGWQLVPRIDPQRCRFHPTCSAYGIIAVQRHGAVHGGWLAIRRLGRCHPWNPGGVDHVPEAAGRTHDAVAWPPPTTEGR